MANICTNYLTITGATPDQLEFIAEAFTNKNFPNAFVPEPNVTTFSDGESDPRRDWRNSHWGDKWAARQAQVELSEDATSITFETAYSPYGDAVWSAVSKLVPTATLEVRYSEAGFDFYGVTLARGGEVLNDSRSLSELQDEVSETPEGQQQLGPFLEGVDPEDEDDVWEATMDWWAEFGHDHITQAQDRLVAQLAARGF
jgi:hypothetical protein